MKYRGLELDPFQEQGIAAVDQGVSLIVSAPTGAGKTLIAEYAIDKAIAADRPIIYTAPIKALSNQKYRDFTQRFGRCVGIMTGDVTINPNAPLLVMTTEIFRNTLLVSPERFAQALYVIFDEIHYLDDQTRGTVWEESLIFAPASMRVMCLSATIPNLDDLAGWIREIRQEQVLVIRETKRPVPLEEYFFLQGPRLISRRELKPALFKKKSKAPLKRRKHMRFIIKTIKKAGHLPCLFFMFSRKDCEFYAYRYASYISLLPEQRRQVGRLIARLSQEYATRLSPTDGLGSLLLQGVGFHHAGMLPAHKEIVECLFTKGLIKLLFTTETFAMGINMPAASVVFGVLKKYDGISVRYLKALEYQQMSGRAGRRGMDEVGIVYANLSGDEYTAAAIKKICGQQLEPIESQFNLSYSTLINLYEHLGEDLPRVSDKSFGTYLKNLKFQQTGRKKNKRVNAQQRKLMQQKLAFLRHLGYINAQGLTSKGRFAAKINGHEIPLTEIFFAGWMENLDEIALFALLVALVFESKKDQGHAKSNFLGDLVTQVTTKVESLRKFEQMMGIKEEIRPVDFRLSTLCRAWIQGASFEQLMKSCRMAEGDIIRPFRQAIQLLRQLRQATYGHESFTNLIDRCLMRVNRNEMNAEQQLRVGGY